MSHGNHSEDPLPHSPLRTSKHSLYLWPHTSSTLALWSPKGMQIKYLDPLGLRAPKSSFQMRLSSYLDISASTKVSQIEESPPSMLRTFIVLSKALLQ